MENEEARAYERMYDVPEEVRGRVDDWMVVVVSVRNRACV